MDETTFTVTLSAILIAGIVVGIIVGFRNRTKQQQYIPVPADVPETLLTQQPMGAAEGTYVTTVLGQELLERVTAHHMGNRGRAQVEVHKTGVAVLRAGEPNFFIPVHDIAGATTISGMAGKFVEKDGILAITWNLGEVDVTTGFRAGTIAEHQELRTQLDILTNGRQTA